MNLSQTIADLEKQAQQYTEAANALRALQEQEQDGASAPATRGRKPGRKPGRPPGTTKAAASGSGTTTGNKPGRKKRGRFSPETRAKISAALKARHAEKKAARSKAS